MLKLVVLPALIIAAVAAGQPPAYDPNHPPNEYRSKANPYYWKNRMPHAAYWQQDVYYRIVASLDETQHRIDGEQWLTYWNNAPDTLHEVFFHLYQQAFVKGGHLEALNRANWFKQQFGPYEAAGKGCLLQHIAVDGTPVVWEQDFSVVRLRLPRPLPPDDSVTFHITFQTYFDSGTQRRRMKKFSVNGYTHYDGVHWYPRICVYDARMGWDTDQHLGKEFYGNFGTYDVRLTFAANYVVGATGTLQNADAVLPADLRRQLDLSNFARKPWNSKASEVIPYDPQQRKTWHFYAENVHDFAFTADPTYRIGETYVTVFDTYTGTARQVLCQALAQEPHAAYWQDAAAFAAALIQLYSRDFGTYLWPKIIVADAADGMEYPMVTLDGGRSPSYYSLLAHEIAHMWFYGHVANNETYRAFMDEGFTQFLESWAMRRLFGDTLPGQVPNNKYLRKFRQRHLQHHQRVYHPYLNEAIAGTDEPINQHSDGFNSALGHGGGYRLVYFKTAAMLYHLQYVLGDSLFLKTMKHYFNKWMLCHPYPEDFRLAVAELTGTDLNWFFDQWLESTKKLNYSVGGIHRMSNDSAVVPLALRAEIRTEKISCDSGNCYRIRLHRHGRMQSPLDVAVTARDNRTYLFHIPNTWFTKSTQATVLPRWYGWDKLHPTYDMKVYIPSGIRQVVIDPSMRMADVYMPDNARPQRVALRFDYLVRQPDDWTRYQSYWRPDLWYNGVDGLKAGISVSGGYMGLKHVFALQLLGSTGLGTQPYHDCRNESGTSWGLLPDSCRSMPVFADIFYSTVIPTLGRGAQWQAEARAGDGLYRLRTTLTLPLAGGSEWSWAYQLLYRPRSGACYVFAPYDWSYGLRNSAVQLSYRKSFRYFTGSGWWRLQLHAPVLADSSVNYSYVSAEAYNQWRAGRTELRLRAYVRAGTSAGTPRESLLYLGGAAPEQQMDNPFFRSRGWFPQQWHCGVSPGSVHPHLGGGLNVRAFTALHPQAHTDTAWMYYLAPGGAALNAEWDVSGWIKLRPSFSRQWLSAALYLFADGGVLADWLHENKKGFANTSPLHADGGLGLALTVRRWFMWDKIQPLTVRLDLPLLAIPGLPQENDLFGLRFLVGVGRSF